MPYMTTFTGSLSYDSVQVEYSEGMDELKMIFPNYHNKWSPGYEKYITGYASHVSSSSYDSVLIGGLGLGVMPYWIKENTDCSVIDVVESNVDVISASMDLNHLDPSINIINDDILTYTPSRTYDLIVLDIWWDGTNADDDKDTQVPLMIAKYTGSLADGGKLFIPVTKYTSS